MKWDDKANQWRRDLGFKTTKSGAIGQHRFRFGADKKPAELAENRLVAFWDALETLFAGQRKTERCLWEEWSLSIANEIRDGKINVLVPDPPAWLGLSELGVSHDEARSCWSEMLTRYFGNIVCFQGAPVAPETIYLGQGVEAPNYAKRGTTNLSGQTLFQAIDSYVASLNETHKGLDGRTNQTGKKEGERAIRLKRHHQDCPLNAIDGSAVETMLRYWSKRPLDATGKRYAKDTCKNQLILIRAFLRWLHRSASAWKLPTDFLFPRCKIEWLQEELSAVGNKKRTYTVKEVGILWEYATPLERSFMALALNCSFGEGEISTLAEAEIDGKVIKRLRHKTKVFGAWWLMPVTRDAIGYVRAMKSANGFESPFLMITNGGKTYHQPTKGNNAPGKIRNAWNRLLDRIRAINEHKDFPRLSFGKLRKTSASWVRKIGGGELASIHIAHGKAKADRLLDVYANRQFKRLFNVHKRLWKRLEKVLVGGFPAPKAIKPTNIPTEPAKVKRILALREQGYKLSYIVKNTDTPLGTVCRLIRKAKKELEATE